MKPISNSASKIVFIAIAITVCLAFLYCVFTGKVQIETSDFIPLVTMAFTYYFMKPKDPIVEDKTIQFSDQRGE